MSQPTRLGLYYGALFLGAGAASPFIPTWFDHRGLTGAEIGLIMSIPMLARTFTAPMMAMWADSFRLRRTPLIWMALGLGASYILLAAPFGFWWWMALWFCASTLYASIIPLTDVIVLARSRADGFNYGWPRGIGSAAFILANIAMGVILAHTSPEMVLVWTTCAALLLAWGGRWFLPPDPVQESGAVVALSDRLAGLKDLLKDRDFMLVVVSAGLIQSAHAFYYSFSTLAWRRQGIAEDMTGILWATGVVVEVAFLWFMEPWRRKLGARNLLVLGGVAAVVRWVALAFSPPLWLLFPVQALHTFSYAATFLGALQLVEKMSSPSNASAAQTLNSALAGGVLSGLATIGSGWLFDSIGPRGYLAMAAMALLGLVGALGLYRVRRADD